MLPNPNSLPEKQYSLIPDMALGWVPRMHHFCVNLTFENFVNDEIISNQSTTYVGYRPNDSLQLHRQYRLSYSNHQEIPLIPNQTNKLIFDSTFEGGNLDAVVQVNDLEYDLLMRVDSNTRGHFSWYNFKVISDIKKIVKFNIINFTKSKTLYSSGMQPFIKMGDSDWKQGGNHVSFEERPIRYVENTRKYFTLTFEVELLAQIIIQIAYCPPYSYTQMLTEIKQFEGKPWYLRENLCNDLSGIKVPLITIKEEGFKKVALVQARIHPGEANGSWMMQGFLEYVAQAEDLRKNCLLKIIPMANPDGVIMGNYRTGLAGRDLNREFLETDEILFPTVHHTKELMKNLLNQYGHESVFAFIDLHGHSIKKNVFLYGPDYPVYDKKYLKCRMLAKLLDDKTQMFRYYGSIFRVSPYKKSTARGVFSEDVLNCFTIEASNGGYYDEELQATVKFEPRHWIEMGRLIGECLNELTFQTLLLEQQQVEKQNQKKKSAQQKNLLIKLPKNKKRMKNIESFYTPKCEKPYFIASSFQSRNQKRSMTATLNQFRPWVANESFRNQQQEKQIQLLQDISRKEEVNQNKKSENSEGGSDSDSSIDDYNFIELKKLKRQIMQQKQLIDGQFKNNDEKHYIKPKQKKLRLSQQVKITEFSRMKSALNEDKVNNKGKSSTTRQPRPMKLSWNFSPKQKQMHLHQYPITPYSIIQSSQLPLSFVSPSFHSFELSRPLTSLLERMSFQKDQICKRRIQQQFQSEENRRNDILPVKCKPTSIRNFFEQNYQVQTCKSYSFSSNISNIHKPKIQISDRSPAKRVLTFYVEQKNKSNINNCPRPFYKLKQHLNQKKKVNHDEMIDSKFQLDISIDQKRQQYL